MEIHKKTFDKLKSTLSKKRYEHSVQVMNTAKRLAKLYEADTKKVQTAGLLHDCSKYMSDTDMLDFLNTRGITIDKVSRSNVNSLLHATVSSYLAKEEYGVKDIDILSAVKCHTLGKENMNIIDKIIFLSDYIEPGRDFKAVDKLRELAVNDLDYAVVAAINSTLTHLIAQNKIIHTKLIDTRNDILLKRL